MAIVANKFSGVRAVCVNDAYTAEISIASNNAQIITFGSLITGTPNAIMYTDIWLKNNFQSERSGKKVDKIKDETTSRIFKGLNDAIILFFNIPAKVLNELNFCPVASANCASF